MEDTTDHMNTSIHLAERPKEGIVLGETFEVRRSPIPKNDDVKDGKALVKVEYLSVDPGIRDRFWLTLAMRGWLNDVRSYVPPVRIGEKMRGSTLCTVMHSKIHGIEAGDIVIAQVCHLLRVDV
jgi:NADPH-dependent curcumin reductase CurA